MSFSLSMCCFSQCCQPLKRAGLALVLFLIFGAADAQSVDMDISASQGVYNLYQAMQTT
ncbi:hypothetical protein [Rufibacter quisquiliarum]|uniref:Uncharacterized protein n=1 Tax=Rufibacter quisquiliarum TaxID=1549639 RepID=A0A839GLW5_9BACT|nr:hypothetical protein [Rufibacter quisquiliarum]MBA9079822.1 hypothetical protein [Rufibacter quisquiliarum]